MAAGQVTTGQLTTGMGSTSFRALLASTVLAFGGYSLLLPVVPLWAASGGAGSFGAGVTTGVLMAVTVGTQLAVPWLLRRFGHRWVLGIGMVLMGAPSPLFALSSALAPVLAVSTVRGIGFGLVTVAGAALVAELVPPAEHGRATGRFGLAVGLPLLVLLPAGVAVVAWLGFTAVFVIGAVPLLGVVLMPFVKVGPARPAVTPAVTAPRSRGERVPFLAMLACATAQGGLITFLPLTSSPTAVAIALFGTAAGAMLGRWVAGELVDRRGLGGRLLVPGVLLAAAGMGAEVAATVPAGVPSDVLTVAGATLVGIGFGLVQNDALVALFAAGGPAGYGRASAVWNIAYDAGTGLGAVALGAVADPFGFRVAFGVAAVFALVVAPLARRRRTFER